MLVFVPVLVSSFSFVFGFIIRPPRTVVPGGFMFIADVLFNARSPSSLGRSP